MTFFSWSEKKQIFFLALVWAIVFCFFYWIKYETVQLRFADQGIAYYIIENLRNNGSFIDYCYDFSHRLGIHFSVFFLFFVPFHFLSASPLTMLFLQAFIVASGSIVLYYIALFFYPDPSEKKTRLFFPLAYLSYLPLLITNIFDFKLPKLSLPFALAFFYFALLRKKDGWALLFLFLLTLFRETLPLLSCGVGLYLFFLEKEKKRGLFYFSLGLFLFLLLIGVVMPYFRTLTPEDLAWEKIPFFKGRYGYIQAENTQEALLFLLTHPFKVLQVFFTEPYYKCLTLLGLFLFFLGIPFFAPRYLILGLFPFFVYYLSYDPAIFLYQYQYFSEIMPAIMLAFVAGYKNLSSKNFSSFFLTQWKNKIMGKKEWFFLFVFLGFTLFFLTKSFLLYWNNKETISIIHSDPLKIRQDKKAALFLHHALFPYFGWKENMTVLDNSYRTFFDKAYKLFIQNPNIDKIYVITVLSEDLEQNEDIFKFYHIFNKMRSLGFYKVFEYKDFVIYLKSLSSSQKHRF